MIEAFATQPNRVAADGGGRNSPFNQALIKRLPPPGLELRTVMTGVRADVVQTTKGQQRPEVWDSPAGEFALKPEPVGAAPAPGAAAQPADQPPADPAAQVSR